MFFCDGPKRHGSDRHPLGDDGTDNAFQHDSIAARKTEIEGDFVGQNRAIGTGIDYEMIWSTAIDMHINQ